MTAAQLIRMARNELDDWASPQLWKNEEIIDYINLAVQELCEKAFVLQDATQETISAITITGSSNISFTASNKTITTGGGLIAAGFQRAFKFTVASTTNNNGTFTLRSCSDTKIVVEEALTDESNTSAVLTATQTITQIPIVTSTHTYDVSDRIVSFRTAKLASETSSLGIPPEPKDYMNEKYPDWENADDDTPTLLLTDDFGDNKVRLYPPPDADNTLNLLVYRRPLYELDESDTSIEPEIKRHLHIKLMPGILKYAYRKQDAETADPLKAREQAMLWKEVVDDIKIETIRRIERNVVVTPLSAFR